MPQIEYGLIIFTPDRGEGGTDKQPVLTWFNDIGVVYEQVKYSGSNDRQAFERGSYGLGSITSDYPLHRARLMVWLSPDGGNNNPDWRIGQVGLSWVDAGPQDACFYFNQDLSPGGPAADGVFAGSDCENATPDSIFDLEEVEVTPRDDAFVKEYLKNRKHQK